MLHSMWCMEKMVSQNHSTAAEKYVWWKGANPTTCSNLKTYEIHRSNLIRPPFLKYIESLSFSHHEVSPLTDWQQHRENPSPGVHTIQAVAPSKAMPAPATASSKSNRYKVASWFGMCENISTSHNTWSFALVCKQKHIHKSTSLSVFSHMPTSFPWQYQNGWRLSHHWDHPCLEPLIRNSQTSVLWYHHLRIPSFGSLHKINWWENNV